MTSENTVDTSDTEAIKNRLDELEMKVEKNERGVNQNLPSMLKLGLVVSILLNVAAILSLFQSSTGFTWSTAFENFITAYKAIFHWPVDWLFSWIGLEIPWYWKDAVVIFGMGYLSANLLMIRKSGKSIWGMFYDERDSFRFNAAMFVFSVLFLTPLAFLISALSFLTKDKSLIERSIYYFKTWGHIILLAIVLLGVNFAFLKIGL